MQSRKKIKESLEAVKSIRARYLYNKKQFVSYLGDSFCDAVVEHFDMLIAKHEEELASLPLGHRYTGVFYFKTPYGQIGEYSRMDGTAFMREDLITWQVTDQAGDLMSGHFRAIYREPNNIQSEIKRHEGAPVYSDKKVADVTVA